MAEHRGELISELHDKLCSLKGDGAGTRPILVTFAFSVAESAWLGDSCGTNYQDRFPRHGRGQSTRHAKRRGDATGRSRRELVVDAFSSPFFELRQISNLLLPSPILLLCSSG